MDASEFFDPSFDLRTLAAFADLPARKQNIWLASYPKSGNTWMRLFLASYLSGKDQADINEDLANNHQCNDPRLAFLYTKKLPTDMSELDAARSRVGIQRLFARNAEKIFIKTHGAIGAFMGHPTFDPASTFASIVVLRSPLAVLPSFARHNSISIENAIQAMANPEAMLGKSENGDVPTFTSSWSKFVRSWIEARTQMNAIFVRYEDMKENPQEAFSKVLAHIHTPVNENRVLKAVGATDFESLKAQDLAAGFKERTQADKGNVFFRSGKTDGWRKELDDHHVVATIHNHWDVMEQLDYIPSDLVSEFKEIKFRSLEAMVERGINLGVYAEDLNRLREERGVKTRLKVNAAKSKVSAKELKRQAAAGRPQKKKRF